MAMSNNHNDSCGGQNALDKLMSHMTSDQAQQDLIRNRGNLAPGNRGYAPDTFHMGALLEETKLLAGEMPTSGQWAVAMRDSYNTTPNLTSSSHVNNSSAAAAQWADQFHQQGHHSVHHQEQHLQQPSLSYFPTSSGGGHSSMMQQYQPAMVSMTTGQASWAESFLDQHQHKVVNESVFSQPPTTTTTTPSALQAAARHLITDVIDDRVLGAQFGDTMEHLAQTGRWSGEDVSLEADLDQLRGQVEPTSALAEEEIWNHFLERMGTQQELKMASEMNQSEMTSSNSRAEESPAYTFEQDNALLHNTDPNDNMYEAGLELLRRGLIPEAVLAFEAAVQREGGHVKAWEMLGVTLAENEQETKAQMACRKCLQLDPGNTTALLSLARNQANDLNREAALRSLRCWLQAQPLYASLVMERGGSISGLEGGALADGGIEGMFISRNDFLAVEGEMLAAVRLSAESKTSDPDLQTGLGILYHMDAQYQRAIDCFQTALQVRPDDALLWNKLGAALANSDQDQQAVHAYRRALELAPGFVRARCNLGIACIALNAFKEALDHGVTALQLQSRARKSVGRHDNSHEDTNIWHLVDVASRRLQRPDLIQLASARDLEGLAGRCGLLEEDGGVPMTD